MTQPLPIPPPGFEDLSPAEKLAYVRRLWAEALSAADDIVVTDAQREELRRRLEAHRENPSEARPWDEVRAELRAKFGVPEGG